MTDQPKSVTVPRDELEDFADVMGSLIREVPDPGTGALAAHYRLLAMIAAAPQPQAGEAVAWGVLNHRNGLFWPEIGDHKDTAERILERLNAPGAPTRGVTRSVQPLFAPPLPQAEEGGGLMPADRKWLCKLLLEHKEGGHCGEGNVERNARRLWNERIDRITQALAHGGDGWIEWKGGENPVPGEVVDYRMRDLDESRCTADNLRWCHGGGASCADIIAYRIAPPVPSVSEDGGVIAAVRSLREGGK